MADNSLRTPGSGETIASDDIGGVKYQRVKVALGTDGVGEDMLNNTEGLLLASAARTATNSAPTQTNYNARGIIALLTITVASGTGGLALKFRGIINGSLILGLNTTPTPITATGTYAYELYPGSTSAAPGVGPQAVVQRTAAVLPRSWTVEIQHSDASSYTYKVDYCLIV